MSTVSYTTDSIDHALNLAVKRGDIVTWRPGHRGDGSLQRRVVTLLEKGITDELELRTNREAWIFLRGLVTATTSRFTE